MDTLKNKKIVVTGGAGFIGSNIVERLIEEGSEVVVVDDLSTGRRENIEPFLDKITFVEGSITDLDLLKKTFEGVDFVIHQAAIPSVPKSVADPVGTNRANVEGTLNVFLASSESGVKRVVYASSSSVYGDSETLPKKEDMRINPISPYAAQKAMSEYYGRIFHELYDLETVGLRYFNVFGRRQDPNSAYAAVIPLFIKAIAGDRSPIVFGDGETTRDFTHVSNVVDANLKACVAEDVSGRVFNIALGDRISLNDLIKKIGEITGKSPKPEYEDFREGDIKHSLADITEAKNKLKYDPVTTFYEGLKKTVEDLIK